MRTRAQIRRRYTATHKVGGKWCVFLNIKHQRFCIEVETDKRRAEWFADMLTTALIRLIAENQP